MSTSWVKSSEQQPTADDARFGMVYVYYPAGAFRGPLAELTRWQYVVERPDLYVWWHRLPAPPDQPTAVDSATNQTGKQS